MSVLFKSALILAYYVGIMLDAFPYAQNYAGIYVYNRLVPSLRL